MKNLWILFFVCTLSLCCTHTNSVASSVFLDETEWNAMQTEDMVTDAVFPIDWDYPSGSVISTEAQSLAAQCHIGSRNQRISVSSKFLFLKCLSRTPSVRLTHQPITNGSHTAFPCLNWEVASEHYIFGMRRILI